MPASYVVTATGLNLRSAPVVKPSTKIATLPEGQRVSKIAEAENPEWWHIAADLDGVEFEGFVKHRYLAAAGPSAPPSVAFGDGREVHLVPKSAIRRNQSHGRAYPLNEPAQPKRNEISAASIGRIVDWLAVETHARYRPGAGATYCNIYAYDYCYLAGTFLPRVWWTSSALQKIAAGHDVEPLYDNTVRELNANSLYDWLGEHGSSFGWRRVADADALQAAANAGRAALICAKRKDLNRSGHIVAVVPETQTHQAIRSDAVVRVPLQSQAGTANFRYGASKRWWLEDKFAAYGFWVAE